MSLFMHKLRFSCAETGGGKAPAPATATAVVVVSSPPCNHLHRGHGRDGDGDGGRAGGRAFRIGKRDTSTPRRRHRRRHRLTSSGQFDSLDDDRSDAGHWDGRTADMKLSVVIN